VLPLGLLLLLFLVPTPSTQGRPAPVAAGVAYVAGKEVAILAAKELGKYLVQKQLESLFDGDTKGSERINELNRRLEVFETVLRQVDATQAAEIAKLRRSLSEKTTAEDVRRIVEQTLASLDEKVREIEGRLTDAEKRTLTLEKRVEAIEDLFGRITYFPPSPLVIRESGAEGKPVPHPQIKEWLNLLSQSEESRIRLLELRRDYEEHAQAVQKALAEDKQIVEATQVLHRKALEEVVRVLSLDEIRLLKPGSPKRLPAEEKLAGMMWLVAVTRPISEGPWKGRLGVPSALLGYQACEILEACALSGVKQEQVISLVQRGLAGNLPATPSYFPTLPAEKFAKSFQEPAKEWIHLSNQMRKSLRISQELDSRKRFLLKEFGPSHEKLLALAKEKQEQVNQWRTQATALEKVLSTAMQSYVQAIQKGERPTNSAMSNYRDQILLSLLAWRTLLEGVDPEWKDRVLVEATWDRLARTISLPTVLVLQGHRDGVTGVAFHPDGKRLLTSSFDKTVMLWDIDSGESLHTFKDSEAAIRCISFGAKGERFVTGLLDGTAEIWETQTGKKRITVNNHKTSILSIAMNPDGTQVVSGSDEESAILWETDDGKVRHRFSGRTYLGLGLGYKDTMRSVAFSPDGKLVLTGNSYHLGYLWDAETGKKSFELKGHSGTILSVGIRPDGKQLLTASEDGTLKMWNAKTGELEHTLEGHEGPIFSAAYSPDNRTILSGGDDGMVYLWDAETGKQLRRFECHKERILSVGFHPKGRCFATGSTDGTAKLWELD
jgi:WD40 repeat protein